MPDMADTDMALQTSDEQQSLKSTGDQCRISGSYVKNVTVKFEEKLGHPASPKVLTAQRSQNMCISISLHHEPLSDRSPSGSATRNSNCSAVKCPGNTVEFSDCVRDKSPATRQVGMTGSDTFISRPEPSDAENHASLDPERCQFASDVQQADCRLCNTDCTPVIPANRSVATLRMVIGKDLQSADTRSPSTGDG